MGKLEMPVQAMRELLDEQMPDEDTRISRDDLDRRVHAANLGEDVAAAIHALPQGEYTRDQLETDLMPDIEHRVRSRHAGLGGGSSEASGKKGAHHGTQVGRK